MNISSFKKELSKIRHQIESYEKEGYTTWRDEKGYLFIKYNKDGFIERFPSFDLRPYQEKIQQKIFIDNCKNTYIMWTRRAGKEVISWIVINSMAIEKSMLGGMLYLTKTSGEKIIWNGGIYIDGKLLKFIDMIPKRLFKKDPNNRNYQLFYSNESVISVYGVNNDPIKLRGTNEHFIIISEAAFQDPRVKDVISPILTENKGYLIVQSTYDGPNHFYQLGQSIKNSDDWFFSEETAITLKDENGNRFVTEEMIQKDRESGMPEFMIQQEYYGVIQNNEDSNYYAEVMKYIAENNRIIPDLMIKNIPVYAAYDLGKNDLMVCTLFQYDERNQEVLVIYCHGESGKNFDYFLKLSRDFCIKNGLYLKKTFVPHDGINRSYYSDDNAISIGRNMGEDVMLIDSPGPNQKINCIHKCRDLLRKTKFNKEYSYLLVEALGTYKKEFDKKRNIYIDKPMRSWACHYADSYQTLMLAITRKKVQNTTNDIYYYKE